MSNYSIFAFWKWNIAIRICVTRLGLSQAIELRGGVEETRLEAKAKDTKKFRGQGQGQTLSRPRTLTQVFSKKKRSSINVFQAISTWENQKKVFADFPRGLWRFPTKFQRFKNSAVLEPRTGQFSRTWGFEAEDFKMCPRGRPRDQGRPRGLHFEAKDVLESSRMSLASRTSLRILFEVLGLGLEGQVLGLCLEASSPRKLACPRLEDSTFFELLKFWGALEKFFWKTFFCGDRQKNFCKDLFFLRSPEQFLWRAFFFWESTLWRVKRCALRLRLTGSVVQPRVRDDLLSYKAIGSNYLSFVVTSMLVSTSPLDEAGTATTCACVLGPWPRAFLSLASRVSVLGKAVLGLGLGLGFFLCPWPWPGALRPRLHLWTPPLIEQYDNWFEIFVEAYYSLGVFRSEVLL